MLESWPCLTENSAFGNLEYEMHRYKNLYQVRIWVVQRHYHIVILNTTTFLKKTCNGKCNIFRWSVGITFTKRLEPTQKLKEINSNQIVLLQFWEWRRNKRKCVVNNPTYLLLIKVCKVVLPSWPVLSPKLWLGRRIWLEAIAVEWIAGVYLQISICMHEWVCQKNSSGNA